MKISAVFFCMLWGAAVFAENSLTIIDYLKPDGSGCDLLRQVQQKQHEGKTITTLDCVDLENEQLCLLQAVISTSLLAQLKNAPAEARFTMLNDYLKWLDYLEKAPSRPTGGEQGSGRAIAGLEYDIQRTRNYLPVTQLSWPDYRIYSKIANGFYVRMENMDVDFDYRLGKKQPLKFGEVRIKEDAPWGHEEKDAEQYGEYVYSFPLDLMAETCREIPLDGKTLYSGIIRQYHKIMIPDQKNHHKFVNAYYLCIWNDKGEPQAVHYIGYLKGKVVSMKITSVAIAKKYILISFADQHGKTHSWSFSADNKNDFVIPSESAEIK